MTLHSLDPEPRYLWIKAKFDFLCEECENDIMKDEKILFDTKKRVAYCEPCGKEINA